MIIRLTAPKIVLGRPRSPLWEGTRQIHLASHPTCIACGGNKFLNVHHILPYHLFPELELCLDNLATLCEGAVVNCHLLWGHFRSWHSYNPDVLADAAEILAKVKGRISA